MNTVPGIDMSTGSLGQGISTAVGMAKGAKYLGKDVNVYCLLGDGEIAEGQVWEASLFAAHYKLDNFCAIVDVNGLQIDGRTADVMNTEPLADKFAAFGYDVTEIDGRQLCADTQTTSNTDDWNGYRAKPLASTGTAVLGLAGGALAVLLAGGSLLVFRKRHYAQGSGRHTAVNAGE